MRRGILFLNARAGTFTGADESALRATAEENGLRVVDVEPGVNVRRSSTLRPRFGLFSTGLVPSVVAADVRVDSTTGLPETVTISCTPPTFIAAGMVTV